MENSTTTNMARIPELVTDAALTMTYKHFEVCTQCKVKVWRIMVEQRDLSMGPAFNLVWSHAAEMRRVTHAAARGKAWS